MQLQSQQRCATTFIPWPCFGEYCSEAGFPSRELGTGDFALTS
jgi:hypothetical protein